MQKRGEISLEALVKMIPHLILTLALFIVIGMFVYQMMTPQLTEPQKDFYRFAKDVEGTIEAAKDTPTLQIKTPLQAKAGYTIATYPAGSPVSPPRCNEQACMCLYEVDEGRKLETCKQFTNLIPCDETSYTCGVDLCFNSQTVVEVTKDEPKTVSINLDCNSISIT